MLEDDYAVNLLLTKRSERQVVAPGRNGVGISRFAAQSGPVTAGSDHGLQELDNRVGE
jgi:hypothetical protein